MRPALALALPLCLAGAAQASDRAEATGSALRLLLPAAAFGVTYFEDDEPGRWQYARGLGVTVAATYALKYAVDAERPNGEGHGFPSGHASVAFSAAAFLQHRYGWGYGGPAYAAAGVVAWSRIEADEHNAGQVLGGALLGATASYLLSEPRRTVVALLPMADGVALRVTTRW